MMAITYKPGPFMDRTTRVPILHKVLYGEPAKTLYGPQSVFQLWPRHDVAVLEWCEENCRAAWYRSPNYSDQTFIEFEDDEDAVMFALRWVK